MLDGLKEVKICTGYKIDGRVYNTFPADSALLEKVEPVYESMPGWEEPTTNARSFDELPANAQAYLRRMEKEVCAKVGIVSVGPKRTQTFEVR